MSCIIQHTCTKQNKDVKMCCIYTIELQTAACQNIFHSLYAWLEATSLKKGITGNICVYGSIGVYMCMCMFRRIVCVCVCKNLSAIAHFYY